MNQPIFLSKVAFNLLLSNLIEIEESIDEVIADFFLEPSKEARDVRELLNEYVKRIDGMLRNIVTVETAGNEFPCVVVGGEVMVEERNSGATYCYKIISPHKNTASYDEISFLSPMGRALLLKKVNDSFIVVAPGGNFEYKVLAVRIFTNAESSKWDLSYLEGSDNIK
ncbi:MAG: GreA/GreB family elongation factor [Bacillota bacterium]